MANCGIMRCEKRKMQACGGIHEENNRDAEKQKEFVASDIDWNKTNTNIYFVKSDNFRADIEKELHSYGIEKWRKDAVTFIDGLYTASPEFFQDKKPEERREHLSVLQYKEQETAKQLEAEIQAVEQNRAEAVAIQEKLTTKQDKVEQLDKAINTKEARLTSIDGEIKAAKDLRKEKADKGLFGRSKDEITIPYSEYRNLQKTARAVEDVQLSERVLGYNKADFEKEKANIQPRLDEVARKEQEASEKLSQAQEYYDNQEEYILATADRMAQEKVDKILGDTNTSREGRMEDFLEGITFTDGKNALEAFEEMEEELEHHLHRGISI